MKILVLFLVGVRMMAHRFGLHDWVNNNAAENVIYPNTREHCTLCGKKR